MTAVANAFRVQFQAQVVNGSYTEPIAPGATQIAQTNSGRGGGIQTISHTTETDVAVGSVVTNGMCWLRNLDTANYLVYGPKNGSGVMEPLGKLLAGEWAWFRLAPGVTLRAKSDTADVKLDARIFEN